MPLSSILTTNPVNQNFLHTNKFSFYFPTMPWVNFFVQSVNFPDVNTSDVFVPTGQGMTYRHGDTLQYDYLSITTAIDEDMKVFEEMYNWLKALTSPTKFAEYVKNGGFKNLNKPYTDAVLILYTNSNSYNFKFTFKDCHPVSITGLNFDFASSPETTPTMTVTYRFDYFELERLSA